MHYKFRKKNTEIETITISRYNYGLTTSLSIVDIVGRRGYVAEESNITCIFFLRYLVGLKHWVVGLKYWVALKH